MNTTRTFTYNGTEYEIDLESAIIQQDNGTNPNFASYNIRGKKGSRGFVSMRQFAKDYFSLSVYGIAKLEKATQTRLEEAFGEELIDELFTQKVAKK